LDTISPVTRLIETNRLAWQGKPFDKGESQVVGYIGEQRVVGRPVL
jgi:hypothetical protein